MHLCDSNEFMFIGQHCVLWINMLHAIETAVSSIISRQLKYYVAAVIDDLNVGKPKTSLRL